MTADERGEYLREAMMRGRLLALPPIPLDPDEERRTATALLTLRVLINMGILPGTAR